MGNRHKEGYLDSLIKRGKDFGNWVQKNYNIKMIYEITPEMAQEYLNQKAKSGVRLSTLKKYKSELKALNLACAITYGLKYRFNFAKGIHIPTELIMGDLRKEIRTVRIQPHEWEVLVNHPYFIKSKSKAKIGIVLARHFALRVHEVVKLTYGDVIIGEENIPKRFKKFVVGKSPYNAYLLIRNSKNGLHRVVPALNEKEYKLLLKIKEKQLKEGFKETDYIVDLDKDSVNKFLRTLLRKAGMEEYVNRRVSIHGLRKLRASELFLEKLKEVYASFENKNLPLKKRVYESFKKAGSFVDKYLGHETITEWKKTMGVVREGRWDLIKKYQLDVLSPENIAIVLCNCDRSLEFQTALQVVKEVISDIYDRWLHVKFF